MVQQKVRCVKFTEKMNVELECDIDVHVRGTADEQTVADVNQGPGIQEQEREVENENAREERYPTRECSIPKKYDDYVMYNVNSQKTSNVDYCYRVGIVPQTYSEAIECNESREWKTAMDCEMESLVKNETFEVKELPEGKSVIGGK